MPALHAQTPPLIVANTRHSRRYARVLRLDRERFCAPFGHEGNTHSL